MKQKKIILIVSAILLLAIGIVSVYVYNIKKSYEKETEEFVEIQKKAMEEELNSMQAEYEMQYNKLRISNGERVMTLNVDSLMNKLLSEKNKVDRLKEELQNVKNSSAKKIASLSKEVGTLKTLLRSYIVQIDSLNTLNQKLVTENKEVKESFNQATQRNEMLKKEKESLQTQVSRAARLDASNISITCLDNRGKKTTKIYKTKKIMISFRIPKNVTAEVGNKTIYARLMDVNDNLLRGDNNGTFGFENKNIEYSIKKDIEYNGEDTDIFLYWDVNVSLLEGQYRLALFCDGNMIGQQKFNL